MATLLRLLALVLVCATSVACSDNKNTPGELTSGGIRSVGNLPQSNALQLDAAFDATREGLYLAALQSGVVDYGFGPVGRATSEPPVLVLGRYNPALEAYWTREISAPFATTAAPATAVDNVGNLMVAAGDFTGDVDLGSGPRVAPLLTQLSVADGTPTWSVSLAPEGGPQPRFVIVDPRDGSAVVASAVDSATAGPRVVRLERFSPINGAPLAARPMAVGTGSIGLDSLGVDADGNLLAGGAFDATITLAQVYTQVAGQSAGYVAKLGRDSGTALWSRQLRRRAATDKVIVAPLDGGDVAVAGVFAFADDATDGDNPLGPTLYLRVARLSGASGQTMWTKRATLPNTAALDVVDIADGADGVFVSATFSGTLQIETVTAVSVTDSSMVMMHFASEDGALRWLRFSNTTAARAYRVGVDATSDVAGVGTYVSEDGDRNPVAAIFVTRVLP